MRVHACIGGKNYEHDISALEQGVQIVVGTPGRVQDLIYRRKLRINKLEMFVLDEADEMLSRGFKTKIYEIFKDVPPKTQVRIPQFLSTEWLLIIRFIIVVIASYICMALLNWNWN